MGRYQIEAESVTVSPESGRAVTVEIDADISEIVDAVGEDELLKQIGEDNARQYFGLKTEDDVEAARQEGLEEGRAEAATE